LERRKYPCGILSAEDFAEVVNAALREFDKSQPLVAFASFRTQNLVQDYAIFDPDGPLALAPDTPLCANALTVKNVYWNPGGDWSSLNIFSPGWYLISSLLLFSGSYLHNPSQMMMFRQKLNNWQTQFGSQGWNVYGEVGSPSAFLRLFPLPQTDDATVVIEFSKSFGLADIGPANEQFFQAWVEYYYCEAMANYYSQTAGVDLLGFTDSTSALKYWEAKTKTKFDRIVQTQLGPQGAVERS